MIDISNADPNEGYCAKIESLGVDAGTRLVFGRICSGEWGHVSVVSELSSGVTDADIRRDYMVCQSLAAYFNAGGSIAHLQQLVDSVIEGVDVELSIPGHDFFDFGYTSCGNIALDFIDREKFLFTRWAYGEYIDAGLTSTDLLNEAEEERRARGIDVGH